MATKRKYNIVFDNVDELEGKIDGYFAFIEENEKVPTVTGLARALGVSRTTLISYREKKLKSVEKELADALAEVIEDARSHIEEILEERLLMGKGNVVGTIFNLKNNYGWKDKEEVEDKDRKPVVNILNWGGQKEALKEAVIIEGQLNEEQDDNTTA